MSSAQDLSWDDAATLLDLQGALLCMRSQEGLLNPENEECVVFYLLPGQGPASFSILLLQSFCYYGDFVHRGETVQPAAHLSPASVLPAGPPPFPRHSQHSQSCPSLPISIAHMLSDLEKGE